jgi:hypothetical protein
MKDRKASAKLAPGECDVDGGELVELVKGASAEVVDAEQPYP